MGLSRLYKRHQACEHINYIRPVNEWGNTLTWNINGGTYETVVRHTNLSPHYRLSMYTISSGKKLQTLFQASTQHDLAFQMFHFETVVQVFHSTALRPRSINPVLGHFCICIDPLQEFCVLPHCISFKILQPQLFSNSLKQNTTLWRILCCLNVIGISD
jgi:hypothetical protein